MSVSKAGVMISPVKLVLTPLRPDGHRGYEGQGVIYQPALTFVHALLAGAKSDWATLRNALTSVVHALNMMKTGEELSIGLGY